MGKIDNWIDAPESEIKQAGRIMVMILGATAAVFAGVLLLVVLCEWNTLVGIFVIATLVTRALWWVLSSDG